MVQVDMSLLPKKCSHELNKQFSVYKSDILLSVFTKATSTNNIIRTYIKIRYLAVMYTEVEVRYYKHETQIML